MHPPNHSDDARFLELLQRWLRGDFTRTEERELQALTDSDDFRREAMEGFMALPEDAHEVRLAALRQRLLGRPRRRILALPGILAVAASLALLLAAVWFFPWAFNRETGAVAQKSPESPVSERDSTSPAAPKSDADIASATEATPGAGAKRKKSPPEAKSSDAPLTKDEAPADPAATMAFASDSEAVEEREGPAAAMRSSAPPPVETMKKQMTESARPGETGMRPTAAKESTDNLSKPAADKVEPAAPGKTPPPGPAPVAGWDAFREYLRTSARLPEAARNNNVSGAVQLEFSVSPLGQATDFKVLKSLGYGCDEEAIRLVKAAGWTPGSSVRVAVEVWFRR